MSKKPWCWLIASCCADKPTHVLETFTLRGAAARPDNSPTLARRKEHLIALFRQLEEALEMAPPIDGETSGGPEKRENL